MARYDICSPPHFHSGCPQVRCALRLCGWGSVVNGRSWHSHDRRCRRVADSALSVDQHVAISLRAYSSAVGRKPLCSDPPHRLPRLLSQGFHWLQPIPAGSTQSRTPRSRMPCCFLQQHRLWLRFWDGSFCVNACASQPGLRLLLPLAGSRSWLPTSPAASP